MIIRNALDSNGNIVGQVSFPDTATEEDIARTLAAYTEKPEIADVTPRQMKQALILSGVSLASIDAALDSLPEPMKSLASIEWHESIAFQRHRPLVSQVGSMLGWNAAQLDALWHFAASL